MKLISQFNTFPGEDHIRFFPTAGVREDCQHVFSEWLSWKAINPEFKTRYGRHCTKCGKWDCLSYKDTHPLFSYKIRRDDRGGVSMTLTYNVNGKQKEFWIKHMDSPCRLELHMRNMTDDVILYQWFEKYKPPKDAKKVEKKPKQVKKVKAEHAEEAR